MDRSGGSYRQPKAADDPLLTVLAREAKAKNGGKSAREVLLQEVEMQEALNKADGVLTDSSSIPSDSKKSQ